jgi:phage terminase Nu1 subunit (DNA packaging protein)
MRSDSDFPLEWITGETLSRADVARIFNVDPATVSRWAKRGIIGFFRGPGHIRIFPECEVMRIMRDEEPSAFVKMNAERDAAKYSAKWQEGWRNSGTPIHERRMAKQRAEADEDLDDE